MLLKELSESESESESAVRASLEDLQPSAGLMLPRDELLQPCIACPKISGGEAF